MPLSLYAFEDQFHAACRARLLAAGATPVYSARELGDLPASRIVVEASPFARASGHRSAGPDGSARYDHFAGQVTFILTTPRNADGVAQHAAWLALVRETFLASRRPLEGMPYQILRFEETSGTLTYINDGERDRSELVYSAEIALPRGA